MMIRMFTSIFLVFFMTEAAMTLTLVSFMDIESIFLWKNATFNDTLINSLTAKKIDPAAIRRLDEILIEEKTLSIKYDELMIKLGQKQNESLKLEISQRQQDELLSLIQSKFINLIKTVDNMHQDFIDHKFETKSLHELPKSTVQSLSKKLFELSRILDEIHKLLFPTFAHITPKLLQLILMDSEGMGEENTVKSFGMERVFKLACYVENCVGTNVGWGGPPGMRGGWSTPGGGCRNSAMSFTGSVPSLHPTGSIRSLRSQHSQAPETPRRCMYCHPMQLSTPSHYVPHTPVHYYTPSHCMEPSQNGAYTPHRGNSYHGDVTGFRSHFYPEGGWGWLVCAAGFLALLLTTGMQLAFGLLHLQATRKWVDIPSTEIAWAGALSAAVSRGSAPLVVGACRRSSTRLTAVIGGFVLALASLFTSFAVQIHQVVLRYKLIYIRIRSNVLEGDHDESYKLIH
ncbi:hypothetical protein PV328_005508 [Microctonus aethiopoides]|uniref:Uncharacterized protein n=1 Tax=Microctonus aethiopoides TaxID=144406 RepID=A0AA39FM99_9HYME|nr:hypothetical protein PV328_005508 [Microctonus aethiopoides]